MVSQVMGEALFIDKIEPNQETTITCLTDPGGIVYARSRVAGFELSVGSVPCCVPCFQRGGVPVKLARTIMNSPSWKQLETTLRGVMPEGDQGFEGLVRDLFQAETGMTFFLARRGDQPAGDGYSPRSGVVLQAKRYDKKRFSENEIEGDIDRALREIPSLDVYVLASTKPLAQLAARLASKTQETGLDILPLSLSDDLSELGALCVAHWGVVEKFAACFDSKWQRWAAQESRKAEVEAALERLRECLRGLATRKYVSQQSAERLAERFRGEGAGARTHNRVMLTEAVARPGIEQQLKNWWEGNSPSLAVLEGEDGMGKTWVAAHFIEALLKSGAPVVLWLDSHAWRQTELIETLVEVALETVFFADEALRARIKRKVFCQWEQPLLLVLDGANEHNAWKAADRLLSDYATHAASLRSRLRLLFTSRPLGQRTSRSYFWAGCRVIPVGPFDNAELQVALTQLAPEVPPDAFTATVRELAVVPRYFRLCVTLRHRLASLHHLNKQILLWADLQEKLENGDPQITALTEELSKNPEEILASLAKQVGWPQSEGPSLTTSELQRTFPGFLKARADLAEQHIVLNTKCDLATLNSDHVVLGWALVLRRLAEHHATEDPDLLCQRLERELEPAGSNDDKVHAVHLATLLTFFDEGQDSSTAQNARSALLSLWVSHHNAWISGEALLFFVREDLKSYVRAVEVLFRHYLSGSLETRLVAPLAKIWREGTGGCEHLREILERWLRLIYPGDASGSELGDKQPPERLHPAETPEQIRLSYAAIGVVSFRPETKLLPALLDCHVSHRFCYVDRQVGEKRHRHSIKSAGEQMGVLLRWNYTESIIPLLEALSAKPMPGSQDEDDLLWFARLLRAATLPSQIGLAQDIYCGGPTPPSQQVETFRQWLRRTEPWERQVLGIGSLESLAVRRDLPPLEEEDVRALCAEAQHRVTDGIAGAVCHGTWENRGIHDLLPWLARYAPKDFESVLHTLWKHVVTSKESVSGLLDLDELMPTGDKNGELVQAVLTHTKAILAQPNAEVAAARVTELMLFHGDLDQLMEWLLQLEDKTLTRRGIPVVSLLPLPCAFDKLAPDGMAERVRHQYEAASTASRNDPKQPRLQRIARYWLQIYAYVARPSKEVGVWALSLLNDPDCDEKSRFALFELLSACPDWEVFQFALNHPALRQYQVGFNAWRWARRIDCDNRASVAFEELERTTSFTVSGLLLILNGRDNELRKWGSSLAKVALAALDVDVTKWAPTSDIEVHVDDKGNVAGITFDPPSGGGSQWHDISSPAWGVDRQSERLAPTQGSLDAACDQFHIDLERQRESPRRELAGFNAASALFRWSQLEPTTFAAFAEGFLGRLWQRGLKEVMDLSFFASTVAIGLLRIDPERAMRFGEFRSPGIRLRVFTFDGALAWETRELWSCELNKHPDIRNLRRRLLLNAANDEIVFWHVAAALAGGNGEQIALLANEWLAAATARERSLGVTLLAFQGDSASIRHLTARKSSDPSFWVRDHAAWAVEVCSLELACKERYSEVLQSQSLQALALGLAELREAFTPMVRAWRHTLESKAGWPRQAARMNGYFELFWFHWGNTSSRTENFAILGRKLREYCRGERLKDGVTSHQSPWWHLED